MRHTKFVSIVPIDVVDDDGRRHTVIEHTRFLDDWPYSKEYRLPNNTRLHPVSDSLFATMDDARQRLTRL